MSANLIKCGGCLRDDASKIRGGDILDVEREAVCKHAEVGVIDSPRRIFEGYLSLKQKLKDTKLTHFQSLGDEYC